MNMDSRRITQVLGHLISNAIKLSPVGEKVHVSKDYLVSAIRVTVKDNGCGVPEQDRDEYFRSLLAG